MYFYDCKDVSTLNQKNIRAITSGENSMSVSENLNDFAFC